MKLNKKFLSCLLAGTMVMAPMTAFADNSTTITGSGNVNAMQTEVYDVVLPTSTGIDFTIDPFGLLALGNSTDTLANMLSNAAGTVTSTATAVVNKSSVGINVSVESWLDISGASVTLTDDKSEAENGAADLYLAITQISGASVTSVVTNGAVSGQATDAVLKGTYNLSGASITGGNLVASGEAVTSESSADADTFTFSLDDVADKYNVASNGAITLNETSSTDYKDSSYVFAITGYANPKSDVWDELDKANAYIKLNMKFTITGADAYKTAGAEKDGSYYWIGSDAQLSAGFSGVTFVSVNGDEYTSSDYKLTSDYVLISATDIAWYISDTGSAEVIVKDANGTYKVTITQ